MTNDAQLPRERTTSRAERELVQKIGQLSEATRLDMIELLNKAETLHDHRRTFPTGKRTSGRFKGKLIVGPEFFEPLSEEDLRELTGE